MFEHKKTIVWLSALWLLAALVVPALAQDQPVRGKAVATSALPAALTGIDVKKSFIPLSDKPAAVIHKQAGEAVALHAATKQAYFTARGDDVYQQDAFYTLKNSRLVLKFTSKDLVALGSDAHLVIKDYLDDPLTKEKKTTTQLMKGKALFYVLPLPQI